LLNVLKRRRDRIAEHWFRRIGPLDRFRIEQGLLWFDDLAVQGGYDCVDCASYQVNVAGRSEILKAGEPVVLPELDHIRVRLTRISKGWPQRSVDVHIRRENGVVKIVGVKR
ncbi:MAG: hypothetical protein HY735_28905, partial [Verrucomicrobia bacterium]|nr:hypothetical protein [Verrucomicrobiota bacterium]